MKSQPIKNITDILQNSSLIKIVQRANELNGLNRKIQNLLPKQYCGLYRIINLVDNQLVFDVPNASIRQGLQLQQAELLSCIRNEYPQISECLFKVNPNFKHLS